MEVFSEFNLKHSSGISAGIIATAIAIPMALVFVTTGISTEIEQLKRITA